MIVFRLTWRLKFSPNSSLSGNSEEKGLLPMSEADKSVLLFNFQQKPSELRRDGIQLTNGSGKEKEGILSFLMRDTQHSSAYIDLVSHLTLDDSALSATLMDHILFNINTEVGFLHKGWGERGVLISFALPSR